jgi:hypothetical protein
MNPSEILETLDKDERRYFDLRREGKSVKQIARLMGMSEATLYSKYNRVIFKAFNVKNWEELNQLLDYGTNPTQETKKRFKLGWVLIPIGIIAVLLFGYFLGTRFPPKAPAPTLTSTPTSTSTSTATSTVTIAPTSTPQLEKTVLAIVQSAMPTSTKLKITPASTAGEFGAPPESTSTNVSKITPAKTPGAPGAAPDSTSTDVPLGNGPPISGGAYEKPSKPFPYVPAGILILVILVIGFFVIRRLKGSN